MLNLSFKNERESFWYYITISPTAAIQMINDPTKKLLEAIKGKSELWSLLLWWIRLGLPVFHTELDLLPIINQFDVILCWNTKNYFKYLPSFFSLSVYVHRGSKQS